MDGINTTWIYLGSAFSGTLVHDEDMGLASFSVMVAGLGAKVWWIFPPKYWDQITEWLSTKGQSDQRP